MSSQFPMGDPDEMIAALQVLLDGVGTWIIMVERTTAKHPRTGCKVRQCQFMVEGPKDFDGKRDREECKNSHVFIVTPPIFLGRGHIHVCEKHLANLQTDIGESIIDRVGLAGPPSIG